MKVSGSVRPPYLHGRLIWTAYMHKPPTDMDKCGFFSCLRGSAGLIGPILVGPARCWSFVRSGEGV